MITDSTELNNGSTVGALLEQLRAQRAAAVRALELSRNSIPSRRAEPLKTLEQQAACAAARLQGALNVLQLLGYQETSS